MVASRRFMQARGPIARPKGDVTTAGTRLAALLILCMLAPSQSAHISLRGRRILVDGKVLFLKGVNWNPVPKGGQQGSDGVHFRGFVQSDGEMMAAAGINAVRTYEPITDTDVLDVLWEKGIYVLNTVYITGSASPESVVRPVSMLKDHPAILMWVIGNEWNYNMLYSTLTFTEAVERVRTVARLIKSIDRSHPVASVYGMVPAVAQLKALDDIDVWGLTAYTGLSFGGLFETWISRSDKPLFVAEYGADAYNTLTQSVDEASQAHATTVLTREVISNSVLKGGPCSGSLIFELADEWWKDSHGSPSRHNKGGVAPGGGPYPDNTFNEEYWGLVAIDGTPRLAYKAYASILVGSVAKRDALNITAGYRMKACGANPGCIGHLGDCCPGKDRSFHECCSAASKALQSHRARHPASPEVMPNAHSHQTLWTAGPPPSHCEVNHVVPCCPAGDCGSCAGDQCCPSKEGSITCPSASRALARGCKRPKLYDCTGKTGTSAPKNTTANSTSHPHTPHHSAPSHTTTVVESQSRGSSKLPVTAQGQTTTTVGAAAPTSAQQPANTPAHSAKVDTTPPPVSISLHTTMAVPEELVIWMMGPEEASCEDACKPAGGCVEGRWPASQQEFVGITQGLGYACFDLSEGGLKFDPSTQQGNCGWNWKGGRELLSGDNDHLMSRCEAKAPAFTRRFCPCRQRLEERRARTPIHKDSEVVMEKFPNGDWTFQEGSFPGSRNIFA